MKAERRCPEHPFLLGLFQLFRGVGPPYERAQAANHDQDDEKRLKIQHQLLVYGVPSCIWNCTRSLLVSYLSELTELLIRSADWLADGLSSFP
jgi:hypothetical protein